jgi:hypothetical protein
MRTKEQRIAELMEIIISASCEAKHLHLHGAIGGDIETLLDDAAKALKPCVPNRKPSTGWMAKVGIKV